MKREKKMILDRWNRSTQADVPALIRAFSMRYDRDTGVTIPAAVRAAFHFLPGDHINVFFDPA